MERLNPAHAGHSRDASGCRRRQMFAFGRQCGIFLRKSRLDIEKISALDEFDHGGAIGRRISDVRHIGDFLPRRDGHCASQRAELPFVATCRAGRDPDQMVIWPIFDDGAFQVVQPGANWEPELQKFVFPDVDMRGFLDREGKAGRAMIENGR